MTDEETRARYAAGATIRQIATEAGRGVRFVWQRVTTLARKPGPRIDPDRVAESRRLRASGASYGAIGRRFGISAKSAHDYLTRHGVGP